MKDDKTKNPNGFTLAELLVALTVSSIILGAVATLAYALGRTSDITDELCRKQTYVRYATTRLSRLIRYSKLVCGLSGNSLAVWRADDNDNDEINPTELVYIEAGADSNYIDLLEFEASGSAATQAIDIGEIQDGSIRAWLFANCTPGYVHILPQCANLVFTLDESPPDTEVVNISFEIDENGMMQTYQMTISLRGRAVNLLDLFGEIVTDGDDD